MSNILILGGTTEASALAQALADRGIIATLSYAGRVARPKAQPVPVRVGGFGGVDGLEAYLRNHGVTHLVDATHPFAATMSRNAVKAATRAGIPHIALTRPAWVEEVGDRWQRVPDMDTAIAALAGHPQRIMLALGRMHAERFSAQPQHHYLLRFVDQPTTPPALRNHSIIVDRGPFTVENDLSLMQEHRIDGIVCKNAGGTGAYAKLIAARTLGLPVIMIDRPPLPDRRTAHSVADVMDWLNHGTALTTDRGV